MKKNVIICGLTCVIVVGLPVALSMVLQNTSPATLLILMTLPSGIGLLLTRFLAAAPQNHSIAPNSAPARSSNARPSSKLDKPEELASGALLESPSGRPPSPADREVLGEELLWAEEYLAAEMFTEAHNILERLVPVLNQRLGQDDPATILATALFATAKGGSGLPAQAAELLETVVRTWARVLGPDHGNTLAARKNLASAYRLMGDHNKSSENLEELIADLERSSSPNRQELITLRVDLAESYGAIDDPANVLRVIRRLSEDMHKEYGPDNADTVIARANLVSAHAKAGQVEEAFRLAPIALAECERVLGAEDPATLTIEKHYAMLLSHRQRP